MAGRQKSEGSPRVLFLQVLGAVAELDRAGGAVGVEEGEGRGLVVALRGQLVAPHVLARRYLQLLDALQLLRHSLLQPLSPRPVGQRGLLRHLLPRFLRLSERKLGNHHLAAGGLERERWDYVGVVLEVALVAFLCWLAVGEGVEERLQAESGVPGEAGEVAVGLYEDLVVLFLVEEGVGLEFLPELPELPQLLVGGEQFLLKLKQLLLRLGLPLHGPGGQLPQLLFLPGQLSADLLVSGPQEGELLLQFAVSGPQLIFRLLQGCAVVAGFAGAPLDGVVFEVLGLRFRVGAALDLRDALEAVPDVAHCLVEGLDQLDGRPPLRPAPLPDASQRLVRRDFAVEHALFLTLGVLAMDLNERQFPLKHVFLLHEPVQLPQQQFPRCALAEGLILAGLVESAFEGGLVGQNLLVFGPVLGGELLH